MNHRVVITGLGITSPVGTGREQFWSRLTAGQSGITAITLFDASTFPVRIGGQVLDLDTAVLSSRFPQLAGQRDRKMFLGLVAIDEAMADARLTSTQLEAAQLHVGVGLEAFFLEDTTFTRNCADLPGALLRGIDPSAAPLQTPLDCLANLIGDHFHIFGPRFTNCSACAAGAQAVGQAFHDVRHGRVPVAIAGASDSMLNPLGLGGFSLLRVLSAENDTPAKACRPFDASRQGTVLGEGAAFLVLESLDHATSRGAPVYAEIVGYASSMDAFRVSDPEPTGRGAVLAMTRAIRDAHICPDDIDCINAHATGTPKNDIVETAAIKQVLGLRAKQIPVHAVKSMTGHMIAASGAVEAVAAALTLHHQLIPPTINLQTPDPECDLDYVPGVARPFTGRTVLSNSFAFGGQNACLIFSKLRNS